MTTKTAKVPIPSLLNTTYGVRIGRACGPYTIGKGDFYRVRVWPEHLEIMSEETTWVMTENGDPEFNESFTFHYHSPLSKFMCSLEVVRSPKCTGVAQLVETPEAQLVKTVIGTGSLDQIPTVLQHMTKANVEIFDQDQHSSKGFIEVEVSKVE